MKLQLKHQKFQADAAKSVVDVFAGQPYLTPTYMVDGGIEDGEQQMITAMDDFTGWRNERIVPELSDRLILNICKRCSAPIRSSRRTSWKVVII